MCYKKPGPRCSTVARRTLDTANKNVDALVEAKSPAEDILVALEALKEARDEYDMTTEGIKRLKELAVNNNEDNAHYIVNRLAVAEANRSAALAKLKTEDLGDVENAEELMKNARLEANLLAHKKRVRDWDLRSAALTASTNFSEIPVGQWHKKKTIVFDLETTGPDAHTARIVTASVLEIYGDPDDPQKIVTREWTVDPEIEIPDGAARIHGVTTERAQAEGIDSATAVREINAILARETAQGNPTLAFNGAYDFTVLEQETTRLGQTPLEEKEILLIDPLVLDREHRFGKGKRNLESLSEIYELGEFDAHNSSADCLITAQLAKKQAEKYEQLQVAPETLTSLQRRWKKRWADNFNTWLESKGRTGNADSSFIIHTGVSVDGRHAA